MKLEVTGLFRQDAYTHDFTRPPGKDNPGGGLAKKAHQLKCALPNINFTRNVNQIKDITIMESLWLSGFKVPKEREEEEDAFRNMMLERATEYAESSSYKILWTSDIESLRWDGEIREIVYDGSDVIACNSQYMLNLLSVYAPLEKLALLTDPVDCRIIPQVEKTKSVYACSQVILEKGIDAIIYLFENIEEMEFERIFLGGTTVWGLEIKPLASNRLDKMLDRVCDTRNKAATQRQIAEVARSAYIFLSFASFESFGYAMIEALLAGCWVFCSDHLVYVDRPVNCFSDVETAYLELIDFMKNTDLSKINQAGREFVIENYSLPVFRKQFFDIVGRCFSE